MMKYVLLFCGTAKDAQEWEALSDDARAQQYEKIGGWFSEHRGVIRNASELHPAHTATSVRFAADGKPLITDGPFLEGTEVIGGYAEIEVADLDEALRVAKTWPGTGVEVRPVVSHD
jgi:hypothetical protein